MAQLLDERPRLVQWLESIGSQHPRVRLVLPKGIGPLACSRECCNEAMLRLVVCRVSGRPALGNSNRPCEVAGSETRVQNSATGLSEEPGVPRSAVVDPAFPRLQRDEMHAVEEWPCVESHRA